jgi:hypothetical protein
MSVDPISILELTGTVLKLGKKIHDEFFGSDRSVDKLEILNGRLQRLNDILEDISEDAKATTPYVVEPFKGTSALVKTLKECRDFLKDHEKTPSKSGLAVATSRVRFVFGQSGEAKLANFHTRINEHYDELHYYNSRVLRNM